MCVTILGTKVASEKEFRGSSLWRWVVRRKAEKVQWGPQMGCREHFGCSDMYFEDYRWRTV